jgi:predicted transcriptional regulator
MQSSSKRDGGRRPKALHHTELMLLKYIDNMPGIRYRQLLRKTNLTNSVLSYHLRILERSKNIKVYRIRYGLTSYYPKGTKGSDWMVIGYLSNNTFMQIIKFMLKRKGSSRFVEIQKQIDRSPSTTSWYIKKLKDAKIISVSIDKPSKYAVINKARISRIVFKNTK